jgi:ubiquinone/menaquinone biosynthesis C-methylase UbiE
MVEDRSPYRVSKLTEKERFYEENKPVTKVEYLVRRRKFDILSLMVNGLKNKNVLNLGCGGGMDCEWVFLEGGNVVGLDVSNELIGIAKKRFRNKKMNGSFILADMENLPFKKNSFHMILTYDCLHHADNILKTLKESYRVASNFIGIVEPNKNCLTRKLAGIFSKNLLVEHSGELTKSYGMIDYLRKFKSAGFSIEKYSFCNIVPPEVHTKDFEISYGFFRPLMTFITPFIDKVFEMIFPYLCTACIIVGKK